jgi:hypothetical protein
LQLNYALTSDATSDQRLRRTCPRPDGIGTTIPFSGGRRQDLDFVANRLPALHPNFFAHISRESYQEAVSAVEAKLSRATDAEFYVGIAQLVAMAGDGHTTLNYTAAPFRLFPLRLRRFDDGIFVSRAAEPYKEALTARLVRIADSPIGSVIDQLATVIPHENDYWLHYLLPDFIINQTILQGLGLAPDTAVTSLTFQTLDGREFTLEVGTDSAPLVIAVSETDGPIPLYQQTPRTITGTVISRKTAYCTSVITRVLKWRRGLSLLSPPICWGPSTRIRSIHLCST